MPAWICFCQSKNRKYNRLWFPFTSQVVLYLPTNTLTHVVNLNQNRQQRSYPLFLWSLGSIFASCMSKKTRLLPDAPLLQRSDSLGRSASYDVKVLCHSFSVQVWIISPFIEVYGNDSQVSVLCVCVCVFVLLLWWWWWCVCVCVCLLWCCEVWWWW